MNKIIEVMNKGVDKSMELLHKIPEDKRTHLTVGLLLGAVLGQHVVLASCVIVGAAVGKEAFDYLSNKFAGGNHDVSIMDAVATVVGGAVGIGMVQLIELI